MKLFLGLALTASLLLGMAMGCSSAKQEAEPAPPPPTECEKHGGTCESVFIGIAACEAGAGVSADDCGGAVLGKTYCCK